jgi:gluconolactonase
MLGALEVFDERRCALGEGPVSSGLRHIDISWVDVWNKSLLSRNIETGATTISIFDEDLSFAIPTEAGSLLLGTANGPLLQEGQHLSQCVTRNEVDQTPMRWNDAKVSPDGDLWLGTLAYNEEAGHAGLYRLNGAQRQLEKILSGVGMSNGMAWSEDKKHFFWIDTLTCALDAFDYDEREISNRRQVISFDSRYGYPDGMTIDSDGGLWIAFFGGGAVRRFESRDGFKQTHEIKIPAERTTSCTFAGPDLNQLIITTAHKNEAGTTLDDGRTYICHTDFKGLPTQYLAGL